ncbi:MAG TPA: NUDIX hydrolase [Burkholderiales bacterium]|nr:NUDIX hydrolase [Burkholderiales bacterium]
MKFCSNCGEKVVRRVPPGDTLERWLCDRCGVIHYENPRLVVGSIPEHSGRLLLCRRAIEPRYGYWTLPAGFMENGETAGEAAMRETLEEAGAKIALGEPFSMVSVPRVNQVHLFYRAKLLDLDFKAGEETLETALFEEAGVPWEALAFRTVAYTLKRWFEDRAQGHQGFYAADIGPA